MSRLWRDYSLSLTLAALWLNSMVVHAAGEWALSELYAPHAVPWQLEWVTTTAENWQSEFLQLLAFVVLTSWLVHKGSPESKDSDEELRRHMERIDLSLAALDQRERLRERSLGND